MQTERLLGGGGPGCRGSREGALVLQGVSDGRFGDQEGVPNREKFRVVSEYPCRVPAAIFVWVRAHGPASKKNEPRSGTGTSEKLYANYVSIGFYDYGQAN